MTRQKSFGLTLIVISIIILFGCATTRRHWEEAKSSNTIGAYENFITQHPNTVFTDSAKTTIYKLNLEKDWTSSKQNNTIRYYLPKGSVKQFTEVELLKPVLNKAGVAFAIQQAAVMIVNDNASYSDLGLLVSPRPGGVAFGGTRMIREPETAHAMKICEEAGVDITRKRIWNDRQTILRGLADGELKKWLEEKQ